MPPITELSRIEPVYLDRLEKQGIFTTGILLEVSETPARRQYLADHVGASPNDVATWRDEGLMLNLAAFGPMEHRVLAQAGIRGLEGILRLDLETFQARVKRAARELKVDEPSDLTITGWWDQARTLETIPEPEPEVHSDAAGAILRFVLGTIVGVGGAALATAVASGSDIVAVLIVAVVIGATGFIGYLVAPGFSGFFGLVLAAFIILSVLLGRSVLIDLPDTPLWRDLGLSFQLGPGVGLVAVIGGWVVGWAVRRTRSRSMAFAGAGRGA